jgi:hypothetical protein
MSLSKKESAIREQRTNLAITKNLMGPTGKLGIIAEGLGDPIKRQHTSTPLYDVRYLDDPFEDHLDCEFETTLSGQDGPLMFQEGIIQGEEDDKFVLEGYVFDGLSRGLQLEIQMLYDSNKVTAYYRGRMVYQEVNGELAAYAPLPEWEVIIERIYPKAKANWEIRQQKKLEEVSEVIGRKKVSFWEKLKARWGL